MNLSSHANATGAIASGLVVIAGYLIYFWRVFKSDKGNKLIECGVITLIVFCSLILFSRIPGFMDHIPDWIFTSYILLVVLFCLTTLFFVAQRISGAMARGGNR